MTKNEIVQKLAAVKSEDDLTDDADDLVQGWTNTHVGLLAVEPILQFMEAHSDWDFGMPGSLVHFVEEFYGNGYEQELIKYPGDWYNLPNGQGGFGIRYSKDNGRSLDLNIPGVPDVTKIHQR